MTTPVMLPQMTDEQQATFNAYYPSTQRDEVLGVLLAVLLGSFGAHHFYLRRNGLGVLSGAVLDGNSRHPGDYRGFLHAGAGAALQCRAGIAACLLRGAGRDPAAATSADGGLPCLWNGAEGRGALLRAVRAGNVLIRGRVPG
jgi:TM2 domain